MRKPIIYVDMDGVLCDYMKSRRAAIRRTPEIGFPQAQYGFFRDMDEIENAVKAYMWLHENFETYILTRPSVLNPMSYTEKREWVEKHLGIEVCDNLIMNPHKGLMKGDYLIDDMPWPSFEGKQILFGSEEFPDWDAVLKFFMQENLAFHMKRPELSTLRLEGKTDDTIIHVMNSWLEQVASLKGRGEVKVHKGLYKIRFERDDEGRNFIVDMNDGVGKHIHEVNGYINKKEWHLPFLEYERRDSSDGRAAVPESPRVGDSSAPPSTDQLVSELEESNAIEFTNRDELKEYLMRELEKCKDLEYFKKHYCSTKNDPIA